MRRRRDEVNSHFQLHAVKPMGKLPHFHGYLNSDCMLGRTLWRPAYHATLVFSESFN